ncbi:ATP-binding protein [Micromonospora sp. NPDC048898]|uniref:ATP-binding protein n=1 Tax=Micromonospora sp. NPDC048898 TaxID=3364260 RepID=UPI0037185F2E
MTGPTPWSGIEFRQVTEVPAAERREQPPQDGQRPVAPDDADGAVLAALGGAHSTLLAAGGPAPALLAAWARDETGQVRFLLGGRPRLPLVVEPAEPGGRPPELLFPPGARAFPLPAGTESVLLDFPHWELSAGRPDALWAPASSKSVPGQRRRGSFQQHVAHLREPFAWVVIAEPLRPAEVQPHLDRLVSEILPLSRGEVGEAKRVELERKQARHRELSRSQNGHVWRIRVLVGAGTRATAQRTAGVLCAAADLADQPYTMSPAGPAEHPGDGRAAFVASTDLLVALTRPPRREVSGIRVTEPHRFDVTPERPPTGPAAGSLLLGHVLDTAYARVGGLEVSTESLNRHTFVCGATGSGKSWTVRHLLTEVTRLGLPWLVIEPAKAEYRRMASRLRSLGGDHDVVVIRPGDPAVPPAGFNPLVPAAVHTAAGTPRRFPLQTHLDLMRALFLTAFEPHEPFPQILSAALTRSYADLGWDLVVGTPTRDGARPRYPTLADLQRVATEVVAGLGYGREMAADVHGFITTRLSSLRLGTTGRFFQGGHPLDFERLLRSRVVFEIEDVGDDADKAFLMGALLIQLTEHLRLLRGDNTANELQHLTVIEEAHRLLRRPEGDKAGVAAKGVEMFAALLAEVRAYGEALVVVEQIPSKLIPDVIKNTAVKVVHRLPAEDDRRSVGATMNLDRDQTRSVVSLNSGESAVFTDGMDRPVLVAIPDGRAAESARGAVAPVDGLIGRRGVTCGRHCVNRACTLGEMAAARRLLAQWPVLTLLTELTVFAHLANQLNPTLTPGERRLLADLDPRLLDCALAHAVDDAVAVRSGQLQPDTAADDLAHHCVSVLRDSVAHDGPNHCPDDDWGFIGMPYRWAPVKQELDWSKAGEDRHPDSAVWEHRFGRSIPGDHCYHQLQAVAAWVAQDDREQRTRDAVTFGTLRPSAIEAVIGGIVADGETWDDRAAAALGRFTDADWTLLHLVPRDRQPEEE